MRKPILIGKNWRNVMKALANTKAAGKDGQDDAAWAKRNWVLASYLSELPWQATLPAAGKSEYSDRDVP